MFKYKDNPIISILFYIYKEFLSTEIFVIPSIAFICDYVWHIQLYVQIYYMHYYFLF